MKPATLGSLSSDIAPIEEDLAARIERELVVSDIGVYPYLNADQCEQIYNEIAVALLDFMFERPAARKIGVRARFPAFPLPLWEIGL